MKTADLKPGMQVWCSWKWRWLIYIGRAHNAKDFEFEDFGDCLFTLSAGEVEKLTMKPGRH